MEIKPKILGVITARGGSKGIPGKNIKPLLGKPLIWYTIDVAQKSGVFDRLIVSTDSEEIVKISKKYGVEVPFMRPKELAEDTTPHLPVMWHAVKWMRDNEKYYPEYTMILQPTAPLLQPLHIKGAAELLMTSGADCVLGVSEIPKNFTPFKAMSITEHGFLKPLFGESMITRGALRQNIQTTYWSTASIYFFKTSLLFDDRPSFYGDKVIPYFIDQKYASDINTPEDWELVEKKLKHL